MNCNLQWWKQHRRGSKLFVCFAGISLSLPTPVFPQSGDPVVIKPPIQDSDGDGYPDGRDVWVDMGAQGVWLYKGEDANGNGKFEPAGADGKPGTADDETNPQDRASRPKVKSVLGIDKNGNRIVDEYEDLVRQLGVEANKWFGDKIEDIKARYIEDAISAYGDPRKDQYAESAVKFAYAVIIPDEDARLQDEDAEDDNYTEVVMIDGKLKRVGPEMAALIASREMGGGQQPAPEQNTPEILLEQGDYAQAIEFLLEELAALLQSGIKNPEMLGKIKLHLGQAYYYSGDTRGAEKFLREAYKENSSDYYLQNGIYSEAGMLLARLEEQRGKPDAALEYYQNILDKYPHSESSAINKKRADILYRLGGFRLRQGQLGEARAALDQARRLRHEMQASTQPNYALILKSLAAVEISEDQLTSATLHAGEALQILDAKLSVNNPGIASTLVALSALDMLSGNADRSAELLQRLQALLHNPLGLWKEDVEETLKFYSAILQKAGQPNLFAGVGEIK